MQRKQKLKYIGAAGATALLAVPLVGISIYAGLSGTKKRSDSGATTALNVDALASYIEENPIKAHELVHYLRMDKDIDQAEVDKLEKLANEVAPQAVKRSLLDLD
ncbi:hypothetical protein FRC02_006193 [Tulasnella sp. 418]|nr:hypothetical protein FRC02_006193 [Tulasnella sp. 418]